MDKADYFSAHRFIRTQRSVKFGIYWPFYLQPSQNKQVSASGGLTSGGGSGSGMGSGGGMGGRGYPRRLLQPLPGLTALTER